MLRPQHHLLSPPATISPSSAVSFPPLPPRVLPLRRRGAGTGTPLRGKTSSAVRASSAPGATESEVVVVVAHREVVRALASRAEARLGARLLPSAVPPDVAEFRSGGAGNAVGSLDVRRGAPGSTIDFMLQSSLHCKVPNGAIDITSLLIFLNASTDAPHFLMEIIQGSPTSIVVILDLLPRKDLGLHPEYIEKYYESTQVDKLREKIEELPQTRLYRSQSLFVRSAFSPTAILISIDCGQGGESTLEEIVYGQLATVANELLQIWLDCCADRASEMEEGERESMLKRDQIVRSKSIEVDLTSNLPRMFDPDVASRVIAEIRKAFGVEEA
uniref:Red chlorophyll catabolite reductase n=1 Tax=Oryza punctata TaxID=4537 RepID=A0A0E0M768_ORYPU